jgi:hypothetical protein
MAELKNSELPLLVKNGRPLQLLLLPIQAKEKFNNFQLSSQVF